MKLSLNMSSQYSGGGVCQQCTDHTTGINCHLCEEFFYHPEGVSLISKNVCHACNCDRNGTRHVPNYKFLDCVKNKEMRINMSVGDCFCKKNVFGRICNTCRPGYFNLSSSNIVGCDKCNCITIGTVNSTKMCLPKSGQCYCKNFTTGRQCNICKDGYYNMTHDNLLGCNSCQCDLGGSRSFICTKESGSCSCHDDNIYGSKCDRIRNGYYYPSLHFIVDRKLIKINKLIIAWKGTLNIPRTYHSKNIFRVVFYCNSKVDVIGLVMLRNLTTGDEGKIILKKDCKNCFVYVSKDFNLYPGTWNIDIIFPSVVTQGLVLCTSVTGLPKEFYSPTALPDNTAFLRYCDVLRNNMSKEICKKSVYTLTMDYLHAPLSCHCNPEGSINNFCESYLGQCYCKPGVYGRACDMCMAGFYNLTRNGCLPCKCYDNDKICDSSTGQCNCPPNTQGRICDQCIEHHWNLNESSGCSPCNCSSVGAANGSCDLISGQCECKPGVEGVRCSSCSDGFTGFTGNGCTPCNCSKMSTNSICDKDNGQCPCKNLTTGKLCDKCQYGSFFMSENNKDGCVKCFCMDVTDNCSMASGYVTTIQSPIRLWTFGDFQKDLPVTIYNETRLTSTSTILMLSAAIPRQDEPLYWRSSLNVFGGSAVSSYTGMLTVYLEVDLDNSSVLKITSQKVFMKVRVI